MLKFSLAIQKVSKFEKNNSNIAVNALFNDKHGIYTAGRSELTGESIKKANFLMVVDGQNKYYTVIKNISRLFSTLNGKISFICHCMKFA